MGTIFRKTYTKPLPDGAEIQIRKDKRVARWKDGSGKTRTAKVTTGKDGSNRIISVSGTYTAKYRDGEGVVRERSTSCRDQAAARQVLRDLEKRADMVRSNFRTAAAPCR